MPPKRKTLAERFSTKIGPPDANGCVPWLASLNADGYGQINEGGDGRPLLASRAAWLIVHGPIPDGQVVMHACDNPQCVNVEHLKLGTQADNIRDMLEKRRSSKGKSFKARRGENHGRSKLTWAQVVEIRKLFAAGGVTTTQLGAQFGIGRHQTANIVYGRQWTTPEDMT